jgi:hypothetical protein
LLVKFARNLSSIAVADLCWKTVLLPEQARPPINSLLLALMGYHHHQLGQTDLLGRGACRHRLLEQQALNAPIHKAAYLVSSWGSSERDNSHPWFLASSVMSSTPLLLLQPRRRVRWPVRYLVLLRKLARARRLGLRAPLDQHASVSTHLV